MPNLTQINENLKNSTAEQIIQWAYKEGKSKTIISTNFNPHEAGILKLVTDLIPDIPVLWVDTGYNTEATYQFAFKLIEKLKLNLKLFVPAQTSAYIKSHYRGIPSLEQKEQHQEFTEIVKLEPFKRALNTMKPKVWITALRRDQTEFRKQMDYVSKAQNNILKVCPILDWSETQLEDYIQSHNLPLEKNYFDPTKVLGTRECGLHPKL